MPTCKTEKLTALRRGKPTKTQLDGIVAVVFSFGLYFPILHRQQSSCFDWIFLFILSIFFHACRLFHKQFPFETSRIAVFFLESVGAKYQLQDDDDEEEDHDHQLRGSWKRCALLRRLLFHCKLFYRPIVDGELCFFVNALAPFKKLFGIHSGWESETVVIVNTVVFAGDFQPDIDSKEMFSFLFSTVFHSVNKKKKWIKNGNELIRKLKNVAAIEEEEEDRRGWRS